ncbi:MAG TPA: vitamin K epoxide reductase family protein [Thermoplasmata archaeon]|nr:vitamin K epoxide reductase family protein [Thermoplasmata archaeon]
MRTRDVRSLIYLAGALGLIVSIYTYIETVYSGLQKTCTVNAYVSCGAVANSGRTTTLGIPDSFIGVGGFVLILVLAAVAESRRRDLLWPNLLVLVTSAGVAFSLYFLYLEVGVIHALCPVCLTAWVFGWIAWFGSILLVRKVRAKAQARAAESTTASASSGTPSRASQKG